MSNSTDHGLWGRSCKFVTEWFECKDSSHAIVHFLLVVFFFSSITAPRGKYHPGNNTLLMDHHLLHLRDKEWRLRGNYYLMSNTNRQIRMNEEVPTTHFPNKYLQPKLVAWSFVHLLVGLEVSVRVFGMIGKKWSVTIRLLDWNQTDRLYRLMTCNLFVLHRQHPIETGQQSIDHNLSIISD